MGQLDSRKLDGSELFITRVQLRPCWFWECRSKSRRGGRE